MNPLWALCILLAAIDDTTAPPPPDPVSHLIPDSLTRLLAERPELRSQHLGYLRELARLPALAESETGWWQASSTPALRALAARFEEALANDNTAQYRFNTFYAALSKSSELRINVENLVRTEIDQARLHPELSGALQFLRANPDIALRFLKAPRQVRPLPEPLETTYEFFLANEPWRSALFQAYDTLAQTPDAHLAVFPWWRQLESLSREEPKNLDAALYRNPPQYWLWHLRNLNLVNDNTAAPWIRYWQRLIQREPDLAREYGPFISTLLENPEQLRQHLIDLTEGENAEAPAPWPPASPPPKLPPLNLQDSAERMRREIKRPTIARPERPEIKRPARPTSPKRPTPPSIEDNAEFEPVYPHPNPR